MSRKGVKKLRNACQAVISGDIYAQRFETAKFSEFEKEKELEMLRMQVNSLSKELSTRKDAWASREKVLLSTIKNLENDVNDAGQAEIANRMESVKHLHSDLLSIILNVQSNTKQLLETQEEECLRELKARFFTDWVRGKADGQPVDPPNSSPTQPGQCESGLIEYFATMQKDRSMLVTKLRAELLVKEELTKSLAKEIALRDAALERRAQTRNKAVSTDTRRGSARRTSLDCPLSLERRLSHHESSENCSPFGRMPPSFAASQRRRRDEQRQVRALRGKLLTFQQLTAELTAKLHQVYRLAEDGLELIRGNFRHRHQPYADRHTPPIRPPNQEGAGEATRAAHPTGGRQSDTSDKGDGFLDGGHRPPKDLIVLLAALRKKFNAIETLIVHQTGT